MTSISALEPHSTIHHQEPTDPITQTVETVAELQPVDQTNECKNLSLAEQQISNFILEETHKKKLSEFSKKHPQMTFDTTKDDSAKQLASTVIESLKQEDPLIGKLLDGWHLAEMQQNPSCPPSLLDAMSELLNKGTCYGQSTKIMELISNHDRKSINEEWISLKMNMPDVVRYQILRNLMHFTSRHTGAYIYGVPRASVEEKINLMLPFHGKKSIESETIDFKNIDQDILIGRLSDFIKNDIKGRTAETQEKDYLIQVTLTTMGDPLGHTTIMYYSPLQKQYFWYEPSRRRDGGLFSTNDHKTFLKSVAGKMIEWQEELKSFFFTAFPL